MQSKIVQFELDLSEISDEELNYLDDETRRQKIDLECLLINILRESILTKLMDKKYL